MLSVTVVGLTREVEAKRHETTSCITYWGDIREKKKKKNNFVVK